MIDLLKKDLPAHYGLHRTGIEVRSEKTKEPQFDLNDGHDAIVVKYREGNVSFAHSTGSEIEVVDYEYYLNGLSGTKFENGRLRCDFMLYDLGSKNFFVLNEQTSTKDGTANLEKPIIGKDGNVRYPGGKYEKAENQLLETLKTLTAVPAISHYMSTFQRKICLMSYVINRQEQHSAVVAFVNRYKQIESKETGENGAILSSPNIEAEGFEYRRISHDYTFRLD